MSVDVFRRQSIETTTMDISPEMARLMLSASHGNRHIRQWHVNVLSSAQKRGEWLLTHQGVAFDWRGHLRDGHHRLMACAQSGVTIAMRVTLGLDPASFDAVDQGVLRNVADITGVDRRVADALRLATSVARKTARPTIKQIMEVADGGVQAAIQSMLDHCGSVRRYYSSAPMKLAGAVTIMSGGDSDFVLSQYRALCTLQFDAMSNSAKALVRQVDSRKTEAHNTRDTIARGLRVFDESKKDVSKVQISDDDLIESTEFVQKTILASIGDERQNVPRLHTQQSRAQPQQGLS